MKERRERVMNELLEDQLLDYAIQDRFKMERHPEKSVDGDDPYERDLFAEEDD
jgi:hypothetical protein